MSNQLERNNEVSLKQESQAFLLISTVLIPLLTVLMICGYGFAVWISQILMGPPGHP